MAVQKKKAATAATAVVATQKTEVAVGKPKEVSVIADLAGQLHCKPEKLADLLKNTVFRECKRNEEFQMACMVAREYKLNPILKEIYAFPSQKGVVPIVSIDGWVRIMNSHPMYDGIVFEYTGEIDYDDDGEPLGTGSLACTAKVFRKDRRNPVCVQEFYEECYRDTDPWNTMPRRMLRWKALIQAARVAFGFAGIYDMDEGNDILGHEGKVVTKDGDFIDCDATPIARDEDLPGDKVYDDEPDPTEEPSADESADEHDVESLDDEAVAPGGEGEGGGDFPW